MSVPDKESDRFEKGKAGFVSAVFARTSEEAERYRDLLEDHDIPAIIDASGGKGDDEDAAGGVGKMRRGFSVMVPETLLDEATEIIANRETLSELELADEPDKDEDDELANEDDFETGLTTGFGAVDQDEEEDDFFEDADEQEHD